MSPLNGESGVPEKFGHILSSRADMDRQWRKNPSPSVAFSYARMLVDNFISDEIIDAPLSLTRRLAQESADPSSLALHALNLCEHQHLESAGAVATKLVEAFAVDCDAKYPLLLDGLARKLQRKGWLGQNHTAHIVGRVRGIKNKSLKVELQFSDIFCKSKQSFLVSELPVSVEDQWHEKSSVPDEWIAPSRFVSEKLNSIDGCLKFDGLMISGWAADSRAPGNKPTIIIRDDATDRLIAEIEPHQFEAGRWYFYASLRGKVSYGNQIKVLAVADARGAMELPASPYPILKKSYKKKTEKKWSVAHRPSERSTRLTATVVVPVYNSIDEAVRCVRSALESLPFGWTVLVIDDASTERDAQDKLRALESDPRVTYFRNESNVGYAATVNSGIQKCHDDLVLLNSDVVLFSGTLNRMWQTAWRNPQAATVTAFSTDDSVVGLGLGAVSEQKAIAIARTLNETMAVRPAGDEVVLSTGVGHCMYVKRACIEEIGLFDEALFPKGYGEETEWCFRASKKGWKHFVTRDCLVFHAGGRSFKSRRNALLERAGQIMEKRFPDYSKLVRKSVRNKELAQIRRDLHEYLLKGFQGKLALLIGPRLYGGVDRVIAGQQQELARKGIASILVHPAHDDDDIVCVAFNFLMPVSLRYHAVKEVDRLLALFEWLSFGEIQIHHFVGVPSPLIEAVIARQSASCTIVLHDYSWICPRINLLGVKRQYCGVPSLRSCQHCISKQGSLVENDLSVPALRERSLRWIRAVGSVVAVSDDMAKRTTRTLGLAAREVTVRPLEAEAESPPLLVSRAVTLGMRPLRVALMGAIGIHKGAEVLAACALAARRNQLALQFSIIGIGDDAVPWHRYRNISITGAYREDEAEYLLRQTGADVFFCASVVPESWCFTLTYAIRMGLPIVAFEIGAQAERLRDYPSAYLVPLGTSPERLNRLLIRAALE